MINALLDYALSRGITSRPGYSKKTVKWVLSFDEDGSAFNCIVPSDREFMAAPDLSFGEVRRLGSREGESAHFLIAPLHTFLGWAKETDAETQAVAEAREKRRQKTFVKMLRESGVEHSQALASVIESEEFRAKALEQISALKPAPAPNDAATIRLGNVFPADGQDWHAWWDAFRDGLAGKPSKKGQFISFGSGSAILPEQTHPKITKLKGVGLSQTSAPIITFDKPAFESYNLNQGQNAALDVDEAKAYVTALDRLLEESVVYSWKRPKPKEPKRLARDYAKIGGSRLVFWYDGTREAREAVEQDANLLVLQMGGVLPSEIGQEPAPETEPEFIVEGAPPEGEEPEEQERAEQVRQEGRIRTALKKVLVGESSVDLGEVKFTVIALSGAGGRVMTRDFIQGTVHQLAKATHDWFDDLSLTSWYGFPGGDPKLDEVLTSPLPQRKRDQDYLKWVTPAGAWRQALWRAALLGGKIPASAVSKALLAHNRSVVSGELTDSEGGTLAQWRSRLRLALVKADLIRRGNPMQPALDPDHLSDAYHCGRLLAVYDDLQRAALGDVGAGVVQRFYGGALTNPSGVFAQLSRLAQTHLAKLGGLEGYFEELIGEIHNGIRRTGNQHAAYPGAMTTDQQAHFALGFWHQMAFNNSVRSLKVPEKLSRLKALSSPAS